MSEDEKLEKLLEERDSVDREIFLLNEGELDELIKNNDPLNVKYFSIVEEIKALIKML